MNAKDNENTDEFHEEQSEIDKKEPTTSSEEDAPSAAESVESSLEPPLEDEPIREYSEEELAEESHWDADQDSVLDIDLDKLEPSLESEIESEPSQLTRHDTILEDNEEDIGPLAEINFGIPETGRWLLKVIGGPNNGAEFYMEAGQSYLIGTDPHSCDIVFHDNSVSRQHAKLSVTPEETILIEDLGSRNGILVDGSTLSEKGILNPNTIVTLGTTSFVIYDREGEMQTIISPLLPSILKALQKEDTSKSERASESLEPLSIQEKTPESAAIPAKKPTVELPKPAPRSLGPIILLSIILGLFVLAGIGTLALFKAEPIEIMQQENADEMIQQALKPFPAVRYSYNKANHSLLLLGHVATANDKKNLLYSLEGLKFIKSMDDSGIVIDEYVWKELNSILSKNPSWKGVTIHSPEAGQFVLSGYLKSRKQAEELSSYVGLLFPYLDLLKTQIIVEEDVISQVNLWLQNANLTNVVAKMSNGDLTLTGTAPSDKLQNVNEIITKIKQIPGLRNASNFVKAQAPELGMVNLSDQYEVTGKSRIGEKYTVVVNGQILSEGDILDGMEVKKITPTTIFLEKGETKYRIDY